MRSLPTLASILTPLAGLTASISAQAAIQPITNPSFESGGPAPAGWTVSGIASTVDMGSARHWWQASGNDRAVAITSGYISQTLSTTVQAGNIYTLRFLIRNNWNGYTVSLRAGGQVLATMSDPVEEFNAPFFSGWEVWICRFTATTGTPGLGQPLEVRLAGNNVSFDDVRLDVVSVIGEVTRASFYLPEELMWWYPPLFPACFTTGMVSGAAYDRWRVSLQYNTATGACGGLYNELYPTRIVQERRQPVTDSLIWSEERTGPGVLALGTDLYADFPRWVASPTGFGAEFEMLTGGLLLPPASNYQGEQLDIGFRVELLYPPAQLAPSQAELQDFLTLTWELHQWLADGAGCGCCNAAHEPWGFREVVTREIFGFPYLPASEIIGPYLGDPAPDYGIIDYIDGDPAFEPLRVVSIDPLDPSPSLPGVPLRFRITFNNADIIVGPGRDGMTALTASDLEVLASGGLNSVAISSIVEDEVGVFTVTLTTTSGAGTLGLRVLDRETLFADPPGGSLPTPLGGLGPDNGEFTGQDSYTVTPNANVPWVYDINRVDPSPTDLDVVRYSVEFSEPVLGVTNNAFSLATSGLTGAAVVETRTLDKGILFNGVDQYVRVANDAVHHPDSFTIECWALVLLGDGTFRAPLMARDNPDGQRRGFNLYATDANRWAFWCGSGDGWAALNGPPVQPTWTHLAGTYDSATHTMTLYVDGQAAGTLVDPGILSGGVTTPLWIGSGGTSAPTLYFPGIVQEVRLWDRALSEAEIQGAMDWPLTGAEPDLVGYWPLNAQENLGVGIPGANDARDHVAGRHGDVAGAAVFPNAVFYTDRAVVRVATGAGDGTLRLNLIDDDSIRNQTQQPLGGWEAGNGAFTNGQTYTITGVGVPAATITAAVSRKANPAGPGGLCDLPLVPGVQSEPRQGGITEVRITFDTGPGGPGANPVSTQQATCASPAYTAYSGASVVSASVAGNGLVLSFSPALENARTYRISLNPSVTSITGQFVELSGLVGDVTSDGQVNAGDRSAIVGVWTGSGFSCVTDVNGSGQTNAGDRSAVVGAWTGSQNCAP